MSFVLDKTIAIYKKPKTNPAILRLVDEYPVVLKFEYTARTKNGKVGNINVTNLRTSKTMAIKPHQCECLENIEYEVV